MNEIILFDGESTDLVLNLHGVIDFIQMSFSLYSTDGTSHIGLGWFVVGMWLIYKLFLANIKKEKK